MKKKLSLAFSLFTYLLLLANNASAQTVYFADIATILSNNTCLNCHGAGAGLDLTTYGGLMAGGSSCGPAVIPFNADGSPLVNKIDPTIPNCSGQNMPMGGGAPVSAANIATIKAWINAGAPEMAVGCPDLTFSAYVEGSNNNKYLEIYNGTGADVNLSGYSIRMYNNGSSVPVATVPLAGTIADDDYFLVADNDANLPGLTPDITSSAINFNGNDAIALYDGTSNIDVFGQIGVNPGDDGWLNDTCYTKDRTWLKIDNGGDCPYESFAGTTDFNAALGDLYTCFNQNTVSVLHTFVPSTAACPVLAIGTGITNPLDVCSGSSLDLSVTLTGDPDAQVLWYESGSVLGSGLTLNSSLQNNSCAAQTYFIIATAANANPDCTPVSITFTVNVLPNPDDAAVISNPNPCEICIMTDCVDITSYSVNGGAAVDGLCYSAAAGENSTVVFTISNQCGTETYNGTVACNGDPGTAQVGGFVWIDANDNLLFEVGEITPIGVQVALFDAITSTEIATITTDFNGQYRFMGLPAGTYFLGFNAVGINGQPSVGAGSNGMTAPFELAAAQNHEINVGYTLIIGVETINGNTASLSLEQIAPQPAQNFANITLHSQQPDVVQFTIFDIAGKTLFQTDLSTSIGANLIPIDLNNFANGVYIISLQNKDTRITEKMIIQK